MRSAQIRLGDGSRPANTVFMVACRGADGRHPWFRSVADGCCSGGSRGFRELGKNRPLRGVNWWNSFLAGVRIVRYPLEVVGIFLFGAGISRFGIGVRVAGAWCWVTNTWVIESLTELRRPCLMRLGRRADGTGCWWCIKFSSSGRYLA